MPYVNPTLLARMALFESEVDEERFTLDFSFFFPLLMAATMAGFFAIAILQIEGGRLYEIATQQTDLLTFGIAIMFIVALYVTPDGKLRFDVRIPDREELMTGAIIMFIAFAIARFAAAISFITINVLYNIGLSPLSPSVGSIYPIVFTSAVYEEIFHRLGITTGLYLFFSKLLDRLGFPEEMARLLSIFAASFIDSVYFAQTHIGVYGTDPAQLTYLFIASFTYCVAYLVTRKAFVPVGAHVLHNMTLPLFG